MVPVRRILIPTDYSPASDAIADQACELAKHFGAEVHVLHIMEAFDTPYPYLGPPFNQNVTWEPLIRQQAEEALAKWPLPANAEGLTVKRALLTGSPAINIVNYAKENGVDLIIMATHGRTGLSHILLGSVAENVIRLSTCPVLTIRPEVKA